MDKIFSDIKSSVGSAVKKSGEILEITKVKMAISDTKGEIRAKYAVLGEKTYLAQRDQEGDFSQTQEIILEIDELFEILKNQELKLAALKKQKMCDACGYACEADAAFCSKCGTKFPEDSVEAETEDDDDEGGER